MLVWIRMEWKIWRHFWSMSTSAVDIQFLLRKKRLATVGTLRGMQGNMYVYFVCCFCVTYQAMLRYKSLITLVTLGGLQLSFHCRKWHRCVGDDRWALDWIWSFHHWRRFNLPFQELLSSRSISAQSWRTGLLLLLWQRCCLLGVQGEGEGGANSDGERESFAPASQSLAESQALGCQRQVIFRSIGCRHFLQNIWTNKTSGARDTCCLFNSLCPRSGCVVTKWSLSPSSSCNDVENIIYTGINAKNLYINIGMNAHVTDTGQTNDKGR